MSTAMISKAQQLAMLPEQDQMDILESMTPEQLKALDYDWDFWSRPNQIIPEDPYYNVTLVSAGRGFGKTRMGSEFIKQRVADHPGCRILLLARTTQDARDTMVFGESGILSVYPEEEKPQVNKSTGELVWPNGSIGVWRSAEAPDSLRGTQFHYGWCDELAAYSPWVGVDGLTAWDNMRIAGRLGQKPEILVTTTPKRTKIMRDLIDEARDPEKHTIRLVTGKTSENTALSKSYQDTIYGSFAGTAIAKQELEGEMLDETPEGAIWDEKDIDDHRVVIPTETDAFNDYIRKIPLKLIAVDPSVSNEPNDLCGIVVVGSTKHTELYRRHAFVIEDASMQAASDVWVKEVVRLAIKYNAPVLIETNQGGDTFEKMIKQENPAVAVIPVKSSKSKAVRAEGAAHPYQQGRVHHINHLTELELQQTTWEPDITKKSPDRVDALVHGVTALLISTPKGLASGTIKGRRPTGKVPIRRSTIVKRR